MRRALFAVIASLLLVVVSLPHTSVSRAQEPERPALGATVTIIGQDGGEISQITTPRSYRSFPEL
jgi:hypothetical protein